MVRLGYKWVGIWLLCMAAQTAFGQTGTLSAQEEEEAEEVERLSAEGVLAYKAGEYEKAVGLFQQALAIHPVPNLLYNIARACELMGDERKAHFYYSKFIRAEGVSDAARDKARARFNELEARILAETKSQQNEQNNTGDGNEIVGGVTAEEGADPLVIAGWASVSAGAAMAIVGTIMAVRMQDEVDSFSQSRIQQEKMAYKGNAENLALAADVTLGAGTLLLGTGAALLVMDWLDGNSGTQSAGMTMTPVWNGSSIGVAGEFSF